jgi:hypothetical protein
LNVSENLVTLGPEFTVKYSGSPANRPDFTKDDHQEEEIDESLDFVSANDLTSIEEEKKKPTVSEKPLALNEDINETVKRQVGDWGVWVYYGKAIGIFPIILLLLYCSIATFASQFPRTYLRHGLIVTRISLN